MIRNMTLRNAEQKHNRLDIVLALQSLDKPKKNKPRIHLKFKKSNQGI